LKKYIIDTNALISFVTDRNHAQQEAVAPLFAGASRLKCVLICHQFVLTEFIFVMDKVYETPKETINAMVRDFIAMPGVELLHETDFRTVLALWPAATADFGDALVAAAGKAIKGAIIVTFDERLKSALRQLDLPVFLP
jgi:predicted nucleic-acid-binding protein